MNTDRSICSLGYLEVHGHESLGSPVVENGELRIKQGNQKEGREGRLIPWSRTVRGVRGMERRR